MADDAPGAITSNDSDSASPSVDNGGPGTLTIADRVGEQIGRQTALEIEGVLRHRGTMGLITGADYPKVSIDMSAAHPRVAVSIAVRWPTQITSVAQEVRAQVHHELARLTGVTPHRVDVTVAELVPAGRQSTRRVQ